MGTRRFPKATDDTYPYEFDADFNLVSAIARGGIMRVPLPDGSVFWSAGRFDFLANSATFTITPDAGRSGNVEAFCAALG